MSILTCFDGCVFLSGFNTLCSACNVVRGCFQCTTCGFDSIYKICHKKKATQQLKLEYIEGDKYIDLATGDTIMIQMFAKPKVIPLPF